MCICIKTGPNDAGAVFVILPCCARYVNHTDSVLKVGGIREQICTMHIRYMAVISFYVLFWNFSRSKYIFRRQKFDEI